VAQAVASARLSSNPSTIKRKKKKERNGRDREKGVSVQRKCINEEVCFRGTLSNSCQQE
jgi:hypothetical protein